MEINSDEAIESILNECNVIAVVGLSSDHFRASNRVAAYMQSAGYRIIPVNPNEKAVLGQKAYSSIEDIPDRIDLVDIFRRSQDAGEHVDQAIRVGARAVWLQEGVIDHQAAARAKDAGLMVVIDRCILKEHASHRRGR